MQRVEEIKEKRQAQFIRDRQKKAKLIEREKDAREVKRDMALIRSPAAGMKRVAKDMEIDENEVFIHCLIHSKQLGEPLMTTGRKNNLLNLSCYKFIM